MNRSSKQRINKATEVLNDTTEELDLTDIFMALHPKKQNSSTHGIFSRTAHILGHKTNAMDNYMPTNSITSSSKV